MRRYHFHIIDGVTIFDSLGTKLPDDKAARDHAQKVADYFARNKVFHGATAVQSFGLSRNFLGPFSDLGTRVDKHQ